MDRHGVYGLQRNLLVENIIDIYKQECSRSVRPAAGSPSSLPSRSVPALPSSFPSAQDPVPWLEERHSPVQRALSLFLRQNGGPSLSPAPAPAVTQGMGRAQTLRLPS